MLENFDKTELEILTEVHPWQLNLDQSRLCFSASTMEDCGTFRPGRCWDLRTGGYDYVDASVLSWHYNTGTSATAMTGFLVVQVHVFGSCAVFFWRLGAKPHFVLHHLGRRFGL